MTFFQFEQDFVESLRCIPMLVRYKLDSCGIKLKLHQWGAFSQADRQTLVSHPCDGHSIEVYRDLLIAMIYDRTGETASELAIDPSPPWLDPTTIPTSVQTKAESVGVALRLQQWATLKPIQRFALIKLSRSTHENNNFLPALQEFGLVD
ncbi:MAG: nitrate reductase maturation protein NarM [Alkalinema sp. RU_4_3]|nr:nitrate reductase maturation protein NarM [Alkalinema sp. RU_4_3]